MLTERFRPIRPRPLYRGLRLPGFSAACRALPSSLTAYRARPASHPVTTPARPFISATVSPKVTTYAGGCSHSRATLYIPSEILYR
jgi:hypothetical protein